MGKILTDSIIPTLKAEMPTLPIATSGIADNSVTTPKLADGAVTAAKADVAEIMNSAGANKQLFGLGGECIDISNTDINNLQPKTGFYMGANLTNNPWGGGADWWYIEQQVYNAYYASQTATNFYYPEAIYRRTKDAGNWSPWQQIMTNATLLDKTYPVGSVYISLTLSTPEQVASALGGGTWVRTFVGRTIVGVDSSQTEFATANAGGGEKYVTLTVDQMPSHTHATVNGTDGYVAHINNASIFPSANGKWYESSGAANMAWGKYLAIPNTGGGQAHNNLQPYANAYIYQRTA